MARPFSLANARRDSRSSGAISQVSAGSKPWPSTSESRLEVEKHGLPLLSASGLDGDDLSSHGNALSCAFFTP